MSKSAKLLKELEDQRPCVDLDLKMKEIIQKHFRDVHDEAVAATVMANNKKRFVKPQYND